MNKIFLLVIITLFLPKAKAQEDLSTTCINIENTQQIFKCSKLDYSRVDRELNETYKNLIEEIKKEYKPSVDIGDSLIKKLRTSQRFWINLRDADCELKTFEIEEGTLAHETETNKCKTDLTKKRISLLLELRPKKITNIKTNHINFSY